jgi:hypothetical protein
MPKPSNPKIYYIVNIDKLRPIARDRFLWSDVESRSRNVSGTPIGMSKIKERRLRLPVKCHMGTTVGEYVPFYYCPRSVMLYIIYMGNSPELMYKGGQEPIVHLEFNLNKVVEWANTNRRRWAIALSNAGAVYTEFRNDLAGLDEINWEAIKNNDFRSRDVKEAKQAEFMVHKSVPWNLVERIGVCSVAMQKATQEMLNLFEHRPTVEVLRDWYY